jgi:hypothetical protein
MKSIKQQYIDLQEGNMSQANFMRNLRMTMPQYVTNVTSFEDSVRILKNKGILTEADTSEGKYKKVTGKDLYDHFKEVDNLNGHEVLQGIDWEMQNNPELTKLEAEKIVIKKLKKNPIYYTAWDMSGFEGYEPETMGPKSDIEASQMQPLEKNMGNVVDKKMGMKPVKDIEKIKKDSDKATTQKYKTSGIDLMSLVAKTVRGVKKMDATGEKMKKINVKENKVASAAFGNSQQSGLSKLTQQVKDEEEKKVKDKLKELIRKQLAEMFDGRDNMTDVAGHQFNENEGQQYRTTVSIGRNIDHMKYKKVTIEDRGDTFAVYTEDATNPYVYTKSNFRYPNVQPLEIRLPEGFATIDRKVADALFNVQK